LRFLRKYYEKIILAVFLLVFIISLILLIQVLRKSMEITPEELKLPMKKPEYVRLNPEEFDIIKNMESEKRWVKDTTRTGDDKDFTDMFAPYKMARCPNPVCQKLIPLSSFVQNGACPICKYPLRAPGDSHAITAQIDSDGDGIPDSDEIACGLNPNEPGDALTDSDNDGFTNFEEFKAKTKINDPKSHPPLAKRLFVESIKRNKLPMKLVKVTVHGEDKNTWSIQLEQTIDGKKRTMFKKINDVLNLNNREYEIKDITSETVDERVDKNNTLKRNVFCIVIQEQGDKPIKAKEKEEDVCENKESVKIIDILKEKEYNVAVNETFIVGDNRTGEEKYTLKSVDTQKKVAIIKDNDNGAEYELKQKVFESLPEASPSEIPPAVTPVRRPPAVTPVRRPPAVTPGSRGRAAPDYSKFATPE